MPIGICPLAVPAPGPQALWFVRRLPGAGQQMAKSPVAGVVTGPFG